MEGEMTDRSEHAKARAEGREQRSREGDQARADNAAKAQAVDEKTAPLKGLRLAKEGADREAAEAAAAEVKPAKSRKRRPKLIADPDEAKGG
jgi:hypothetical protein